MAKQFPHQPNLEQLKKQARQLLKAQRAGDLQACRRFQTSLPRLARVAVEDVLGARVTPREAQHVLAREYGLANWKALVDIMTASAQDETFRKFNQGLEQTIWSKDLYTLIQEAHSADSDTTELTMTSGAAVRLEHNPAPGMGLRLSKPGDPTWMILRVEPARERPGWYPPEIPFMAGQPAWIARDGTRHFAVWSLASVDDGRAEEAERLVKDHPAWKTFTQTAQPLIAGIREGSAEARQRLFAMSQDEEATRSWAGDLAQLVQQFEALIRGDDQIEALVQAVLDQSLEDGWTLVEEKGTGLIRFFVLERRGALRTIQVLNTAGTQRLQLWDSVEA